MEMKKQLQKKKWLLPLILTLFTSTILITYSIKNPNPFQEKIFRIKPKVPIFVESKLHPNPPNPTSKIPRLAYLISGSKGDCQNLKRAVKALYHPLNQYVLHLDLESSAEERIELARFVEKEALFGRVGNVRVMEKSNLITYRGPTMVSNTLHGAAVLLKEGGDWDWFINLSASDYPLVTQDDLLHTLSTIPRDLNFIEHTSDIGWKEHQRAQPIIIDPSLYSLQKSDLFWINERRPTPTTFKLFTGSAWMMLTRSFMEFCLWGWDNVPRILLMYYTNFLSSPEGYFHTVICNVEEFRNTTVNHDLHFISWDNPPKQHPHFLSLDDYQRMIESNAPFARKFGRNADAILDKIDSQLLGRKNDGFVPGSWFAERNGSVIAFDSYAVPNITEFRPGPGAERIKNLIHGLIYDKDFQSKHCV